MIASSPADYPTTTEYTGADYDPVAAGPGSAVPGEARQARLAAAVGGMRLRRGRIPVEQVLLIAGTILFPLGLVFILLGWEGAAHNGHTYAQIDYLISGGIFGLGLSVAGGFMYFGYWLSRQLGESRRQSAATVQSLQRLEDLLDFALTARTTGPVPAVGGPAPVVNGTTLYATPRGSLLHRPDCPVVARRDNLKAVAPGTEGYGYCTMCRADA